jgi:hypothetical protein
MCSNLVAMIQKIYLFNNITIRILAPNKISKLAQKYFSHNVQKKKELFQRILRLFNMDRKMKIFKMKLLSIIKII